jgi:non-canonical (house-cleaning) NTP pyrophosphatase
VGDPVGKWDASRKTAKAFVRGQLTPGSTAGLRPESRHGAMARLKVCLSVSVTKDDYSIGVNGGTIFKNISWLKEISVCTFRRTSWRVWIR